MRVIVAAVVAVLGIGMFAVAALLWDRRHQLNGTARNPGETAETGPAAAQTPRQRYLPHLLALAAIVLGIGMMIGSCAGLLSF